MAALFSSAGPWHEPTIIDGEEVPLAVVRHEGVRLDGLRDIFDSSFGPVVIAITLAGLTMSGPAIAVYEGDVSETFTLEVGFPVDHPLPEPTELDGISVIPSQLAAGQLAVLSHIGPYDQLGESWGRLMGWAGEQGLVPGARYGEVYVTEPTPDGDPSALRSDIFLTLG